jgi:hypothetical protein
MKNAYLTKHAQQRLRERHDRHLLPYNDEASFLYSCLELFNGRATETNRHLNDTALMLHLREQYGYEHNYTFRVYENALFVIVDTSCVTVLDTDIHSYSRQFNAPAAAPTGRTVKRRLPDSKFSRVQLRSTVERSQRYIEEDAM